MTRHLTKILLAASALTVLAAAPAAFAAPAVDTKPIAAKQNAELTKVADRGDRSNRNRGQRSDRNRSNRNRSDRNRRSDSHRSDGQRSNRHRSDRNRSQSSDRGYRNRDVSRSHTSRHRNYSRPVKRHYNTGHRGYRTSYRSNRGISFHFGSPGYSRYRWSPAAYSFYRPAYGSYGYYQRSTVCHRINVEGWHHGRPALVSVKQCSNPWDGSYIVQGSERLVTTYW